jgi:hypothetical protein
MEGFKKLPKMACFKEGGHIGKEHCSGGKVYKKAGGEIDKADIAQDKKIVKKAIAMHDKQEHEGEHTDLSKLRKGGRAKKETGTVKKFKTGGGVYGAKKDEADKKAIAEEKKIVPKKASAPSKASEKPAMKGSDVKKEKSLPAGDRDVMKKVKPTGDKMAMAPSAAMTQTPFEAEEDMPGYADGGGIVDYVRNKILGTPAQNAQARRDMQALARQRGMMGGMAAAGNAMDNAIQGAPLGAAQGADGLGRAATNVSPQPGITPGRYKEGGDVHVHHHYHGVNDPF